MGVDMSGKAALHCESTTANGADKRPVACVCAYVCHEVALHCECLGAEAANKRPFTRVHSAVLLQRAPLRK